MTIGLAETLVLPILASSPRPVSYQLLDQLLELQARYGFPWEYLGIDDSGTQSVADIVEATTKISPVRVVFNSRASDTRVSNLNPALAKEVYKDQITEYYYALAEYGRCNQIRGLPPQAASQFCSRRLAEAKYPRQLESKKLYKLRIKRSPDQADAVAMVMAVVRSRMRLLPGDTNVEPQRKPQAAFDESLLQIYDIDASEYNYTKQSF